MRKFIVTMGVVAIVLEAGIAGAAVPKGGAGGRPLRTAPKVGAQGKGKVGALITSFDMPNGVKVLLPVDPPLGQEYAGLGALVVPPGMTWRLMGFTFNITFDTSKPGAGNVSMVVRDPDGNSHLRIPLANGLDRASHYVDFSGWVGAPQGPAETFDHECILASIPDLTLPAGWQLTTLTEGRKSTDKVQQMQLWVQEAAA